MSIKDVTENFQLVREWAEARNLIAGATAKDQYVKLVEEISEFTQGIDDGDEFEIYDGLGDTVVVLTILAEQLGTNIETCIASVDYMMDEANARSGLLCKSQGVSGLIHTLVNSIGQLATGISKKNHTKVEFGIGMAYRVVEAISYRYNSTIEENLDKSYNVIKDRKGRMIDGTFVKEADLATYGIAS